MVSYSGQWSGCTHHERVAETTERALRLRTKQYRGRGRHNNIKINKKKTRESFVFFFFFHRPLKKKSRLVEEERSSQHPRTHNYNTCRRVDRKSSREATQDSKYKHYACVFPLACGLKRREITTLKLHCELFQEPNAKEKGFVFFSSYYSFAMTMRKRLTSHLLSLHCNIFSIFSLCRHDTTALLASFKTLVFRLMDQSLKTTEVVTTPTVKGVVEPAYSKKKPSKKKKKHKNKKHKTETRKGGEVAVDAGPVFSEKSNELRKKEEKRR